MSHPEIPLAAALIPAFIGFCALRRRGKPGATALAALMWSLAGWCVVHAFESMTHGAAKDALLRVEQIILLAPAPFWLIFTIRYTGRERWLTRKRAAFVAAASILALVLVLTGGTRELAWSLENFSKVSGAGETPARALSSVALFWVHLAYRTLFFLLGSVFLLILLLNSRRLYVMQSLCLFVGFFAPWAATIIHQFEPGGFAFGAYMLPSSFAVSGLALAWALFRYRLLDISPVAQEALVEGMSDGTIALDRQFRVMDLNPAAEFILGCDASEILGEDFRTLMSSRAKALSGKRASEFVRRYEEQGKTHEEIQLGKDERARHYDVSLSALYDALGKRTGDLVVLHEITDRKLVVERLDRMAHYDSLTGLPNRAYFRERLNEELARARRKQGQIALLFLDLDGFKKVNDTLGHEVGDLLLEKTADRLKLAVREYDFVARLAGDEFTIILTEIAESANATSVAERIVRMISEPYELAGKELQITTSVGITLFPTGGTDPATLTRNADAAMYQAKQAGKNRYALFTPLALPDSGEYLDLEADLANAIANGELTLFYLPEICARTGRVVGAEALLRWEHPERGLLRSEDFMPLAEEFDLTLPIERWVLREACHRVRSWQERYRYRTPLTVSVGLSPRRLANPRFAEELANILEETRIPPDSLILNIKESVLGDQSLSASASLRSLKDLGVRLAVDDFGVGSTSLTQLMSLPLDMLKIDSSFISRLQDDAETAKVVSAIIALARVLDLTVLARGVGNPRQLMRLKEIGCDAVQGPYFASSLSDRETSAFLVADLYY